MEALVVPSSPHINYLFPFTILVACAKLARGSATHLTPPTSCPPPPLLRPAPQGSDTPTDVARMARMKESYNNNQNITSHQLQQHLTTARRGGGMEGPWEGGGQGFKRSWGMQLLQLTRQTPPFTPLVDTSPLPKAKVLSHAALLPPPPTITSPLFFRRAWRQTSRRPFTTLARLAQNGNLPSPLSMSP